jgi:hypothetical protein
MAAHNYYGRLHELLETPEPQRQTLENAYRDHAHQLWDALNQWLETWEGERGIPTAYVVGPHAYVGLPLSQALVRRADRERLPTLFSLEGLPPGYQMAPGDMESTLATWVQRTPPFFSNTLRALWSTASARERIAAVACVELESWDGAGLEQGQHSEVVAGRQLRLLAQLRHFPRRSFLLDIAVPDPSGDLRTIELNGTDGPTAVSLGVSLAGTSRLASTSDLDFDSVLCDHMAAKAGATSFRRSPRRVVPFRYDELQQSWIEIEYAQLGERTLVLAADALDAKLEKFLGQVARPGWSRIEVAGIPHGWSLFQDVEILDRSGGVIPVDFQPLLPRSSVSLVMSGGLLIPGLLRKWSSLQPPEIHATSPGADEITIDVHLGSRVGDVVLSESYAGGVGILPLEGHGLADGEYLVVVRNDGSTKPAASSLLRLRSGETPEARRAESRLVLAPGTNALWPLSAAGDPSLPHVDGARVTLPPVNGRRVAMTAPSHRPRSVSDVVRGRSLRLGLGLADDSCMRTGMHRFVVPPVVPGVPSARSVESACTTCGLVKRFPTTAAGAAAKKKAKAKKALWQPPDLTSVPPIRSTSDDVAWFHAFDALTHLGNGTPAALGRLIGQLDGTSLGLDVLVRGLEVLGHVDVVRDVATLEVREWEVTPSTLAQVGTDRWLLVGRRTSAQTNALSELVAYSKGRVERTLDGQVPRLALTLDASALAEVVDVMADDGWSELYLSFEPALGIARSLPPLSSVEHGLARRPVPAATQLERWDTTSASWQRASTIEEVGAYRVTHHSRSYVLRSAHDLEQGTVALSNVQVAKHVANAWANDPLVRYDETSASVVVPLGADLPGLWGRALALCSGVQPLARESDRLLQYPAVPREVADLVATSLAE